MFNRLRQAVRALRGKCPYELVVYGVRQARAKVGDVRVIGHELWVFAEFPGTNPVRGGRHQPGLGWFIEEEPGDETVAEKQARKQQEVFYSEPSISVRGRRYDPELQQFVEEPEHEYDENKVYSEEKGWHVNEAARGRPTRQDDE